MSPNASRVRPQEPVLRVGLTGGIGSGKSTAAAVFAGLGAVVVDADRIARDVVAVGTPGLASIVETFGARVVTAAGDLDRAALAGLVFADPAALAALEGITHPLIWAEAARQFAAVPPGGIAVHDMPLLVEKRMSAGYHLVVAVLTETQVRVDRLVTHRGLVEADARRRIAAQASDEERRAAADVVLDNNGPPETLRRAAETLWHSRIEPYAANLRRGIPARAAPGLGEKPLEDVAAQGNRVLARVRRALGEASSVTSGASAATRDGHLVLGLHHPGSLDRARLAEAGYPVVEELNDGVRLGNCDPAWPAAIDVTASPTSP